MFISIEHKFIFVHVHKTGGTSVRHALSPCQSTYLPRWLFRRPPPLKLSSLCRRSGWLRTPWHEFHPHITAREIRALIKNDYFDKFFSFGFVRNPWDLLVSIYHFVGQNLETFEVTHPHLMPHLSSFEAFADFTCSAPPIYQSDFLCDENGRVLVDFVGRFETLAEDFQTICDKVGIGPQIEHLNASRHSGFRDYYTPSLARKVGEFYAPDVEAFGYQAPC